MIDRQFTELDLRRMLEKPIAIRPDIVPNRWIAATRFRRRRWDVVLEPDPESQLVVVITAYPVE